jgi:pyruvate ferredoxin oxidoreductase gamma subunit
MRTRLGLDGSTARVYTLDATTISLETIGRVMPNTPLLGALAKVTEFISLEALIDNFRENYAKKFSSKVIEGNVEAMKRSFAEVVGG